MATMLPMAMTTKGPESPQQHDTPQAALTRTLMRMLFQWRKDHHLWCLVPKRWLEDLCDRILWILHEQENTAASGQISLGRAVPKERKTSDA